jgi:hypothetical protein
MPFTCMYGTVVTAISRQVREQYYNVPWLNVAFDGQEETNLLTRLEAFMHQVNSYQNRRKAG